MIVHRKHSAREFCDMVVDQFDEMLEQCVKHPLVCNISIHPYVFGQPFRLRPLRIALEHCVEHKQRDRVWWTRPGEIAEFCNSMQPGIIPGSSEFRSGTAKAPAKLSATPLPACLAPPARP